MVGDDQPDAREGRFGRCGVTERPVVPMKPGNSGGGKGPHFGSVLEVVKRRESGHVAYNLHATMRRPQKGLRVRRRLRRRVQSCAGTRKPVGEPDALIGHVRFDERGVETGVG